MGLWKSKDHKVHEIKAEELKSALNKPGLMIINVLGEEYYTDCRIPGSINIPVAELDVKAKQWPKDKEIIVYCASYDCSASKNGAKKLQEFGFTNVRAYEGGVKEWRKKGWPTEGPCALTYLED